MSTNDQQQTPPQQPQDAQQGTAAQQPAPKPAEPPQEPAEPQDKGNKEAARYRTQLRATEAERDTAREQLGKLREAILANALQAHGITPKALRAAVDDVDQLVAEDGTVDAQALAQAVATARDALGIARPAPRSPAAGRMNSPEAARSVSAGMTWAQLMSGQAEQFNRGSV